jgi:hypothetical protein
VGATDDNDDLAYLSQPRFGWYAAIVLAVLVATACLLATGFYDPTRADALWALASRKSLPEHSEPLDDSTVISLTRTMCFGWCPEYTVRIFGSGRVEYVGTGYVCTYGAQAATADPREVRRLAEAMIEAGYFDYEWKQGPFSTDNPTANSSLRHAGRSYALCHYHGDQGAPRWLHAMEDEIDRVAGTARWLPRIGEETGWRAVCLTPDGGMRDVTRREPLAGPPDLDLDPAIEPPPLIEMSPPRYDVRL